MIEFEYVAMPFAWTDLIPWGLLALTILTTIRLRRAK